MNIKYVGVCLVTLLPSLVCAQQSDNYQCTKGENIRRVEILREGADPVPCEVRYYKDTEMPGSHQVLWNASADAGYCSEKTVEFVAKLRDWGWDCGPGVVSTSDDSEAPAVKSNDELDDTAVLAPAEDDASMENK